ncbi:MAG: amidohydrolase family protein [Planctomycetia bacterium]|nr:amidohydrolase family protein [Planctomycetia bacterium]
MTHEQDTASTWLLEGDLQEKSGLSRDRLLICTESGKILDRGDLPGDPDVIWPEGVRVCPGFIDIHVHCRDDPGGSQRYKEDYLSSSQAAIQGGVVLLGDMPNNPDPPSHLDAYQRKKSLADETSLVDVVLYGLLTRGGDCFSSEIPWKCYFGPSVGEIDSWGDDSVASVLENYRGQRVMFHAEDPRILKESQSASTHESRRPPEAEVEAISTILGVCRELEIIPHIAHLSTGEGLRTIERAREGGQTVTTEVTPHHLAFDMENRQEWSCGDWLQMNPPLRSPEDRHILREGLLSGSIDAIATDHAPHSLEENSKGISGVPHLDTFGAYVCQLAEEGFPWEVLVERASTRPAELFGPFTGDTYGSLLPGALASLTITDTRSPWTLKRSGVQSRAGWSPFEDRPFPGKVIETVIRGIRRDPASSKEILVKR